MNRLVSVPRSGLHLLVSYILPLLIGSEFKAPAYRIPESGLDEFVRCDHVDEIYDRSDDMKSFTDGSQIVFLTRKDKIRQAISRYKYELTRVHAAGEKTSRARVENSAYNFTEILKYVNLNKASTRYFREILSERGLSLKTVYYEDLVETPEKIVREVMNFWGFDVPKKLKLETSLVRLSDEISDIWYQRFLKERT